MTSAKIAMFLRERDRALLRGDVGVIRSCTADLRRLGVVDSATLADPSGRQSNAKRGTVKPRKPRCEHGAVVEHCPECQDNALMVNVPYNTRLEQ